MRLTPVLLSIRSSTALTQFFSCRKRSNRCRIAAAMALVPPAPQPCALPVERRRGPSTQRPSPWRRARGRWRAAGNHLPPAADPVRARLCAKWRCGSAPRRGRPGPRWFWVPPGTGRDAAPGAVRAADVPPRTPALFAPPGRDRFLILEGVRDVDSCKDGASCSSNQRASPLCQRWQGEGGHARSRLQLPATATMSPHPQNQRDTIDFRHGEQKSETDGRH